MCELTGKEFNEKFGPEIRLIKFTKWDCENFGFKYRSGLNVDNIPFQPFNECLAGGLYFTSLSWNYLPYIGTRSLVWDVTIPDDARVYIEPEGKAKADKIILSNSRSIMTIVSNITIDDITNYPNLFRHIRNPSMEMNKAAVMADGLNLQYVKNPTLEMMFIAIQQNGCAIRYIDVQTDEMKQIAMDADPNSIEWIDDPSYEHQLKAVQHDGMNLNCIDDPSDEVIIAAITDVWEAINCIDEPTLEMQLAAVRGNPKYIREIEEPTLEMQLAAVNGLPRLIKYIKNQYEEVKWLAIMKDPHLYKYIKFPSDKIKHEVNSKVEKPEPLELPQRLQF